MRGLRAVYYLALSDYLERTRRSSFLIIVALTVAAGYFYLPANSSTTTLAITLDFGGYRVEVVFVTLWYIGAINHLPALDFMGATASAIAMHIPLVYGITALALLVLAFLGRRRQLSM